MFHTQALGPSHHVEQYGGYCPCATECAVHWDNDCRVSTDYNRAFNNMRHPSFFPQCRCNYCPSISGATRKPCPPPKKGLYLPWIGPPEVENGSCLTFRVNPAVASTSCNNDTSRSSICINPHLLEIAFHKYSPFQAVQWQ
jgi:hypothetical protein